MKFRGLIAACLTGALLLPAGCADDNPKMEVPDTDTTAFVQMKQTNLEEWKAFPPPMPRVPAAAQYPP